MLLLPLLLIGCTSEEPRSFRPSPAGDRGGGADGASGEPGTTDGGDLSAGDGVQTGDSTGPGDGTPTGDGGAGDEDTPGDRDCPPCLPPPSPDCVGTGPCGCGPYECPGDADRICGINTIGWCPSGVSCQCCPGGGPKQNCLCTTTCRSSGDCKDPDRPVCNQVAPETEGLCTSTEFFCCWLCG